MIGGLLDVARIETGSLLVVPEPSWLAGGGGGGDSGQQRVLAVDDDPEALRHVREALVKAGYAPVVTGNPRDVPRLLDTEKPHAVLLDLMLPGTDGIELMQDIQRWPRRRRPTASQEPPP